MLISSIQVRILVTFGNILSKLCQLTKKLILSFSAFDCQCVAKKEHDFKLSFKTELYFVMNFKMLLIHGLENNHQATVISILRISTHPQKT